jgi:hypothetical protein
MISSDETSWNILLSWKTDRTALDVLVESGPTVLSGVASVSGFDANGIELSIASLARLTVSFDSGVELGMYPRSDLRGAITVTVKSGIAKCMLTGLLRPS